MGLEEMIRWGVGGRHGLWVCGLVVGEDRSLEEGVFRGILGYGASGLRLRRRGGIVMLQSRVE